MKVAFVIQDLFGRGAEHATALLVGGFAAKGYDVDLLVSKVHDDKLAQGLKPFAVPETVKVIHLKHRKARYNVLEIRRYLRRTQAVAVVQMGGGYERAIALASLGLRKCPRLYAVRHTIDFALDADGAYKAPRNGLVKRLRDWWHYRAYDGVLCVAERVRMESIRQFHLAPEKVHTVYNPAVDDDFFEKMRATPTHPWIVNRDTPVFVAAGAFAPEKDHLTVMEAFRLVNQRRRARLVIFGSGPLQDDYRRFIKEHGLEEVVSLPGFSNSLPAEIKASDGYISSSVLESFGIAIVEGLACGVPVIATDAPCGPCEVLDGGRYGELIPMRNPVAMAKAVEAVLEGKIKPASEDAWRRFELDRVVAYYERALDLPQEASAR